MTLQERPRANDDSLTLAVVKYRITEWCEWFDIAPPKLKTRKGEVYLTDELHAWMMAAGASFDWIFRGDAKAMAAAYRRDLFARLDAGDKAAAQAEEDEGEPDPELVEFLRRMDEERDVIELYRALNPEEKAKMLWAVSEGTQEALEEFGAFLRQSRGLPDDWPGTTSHELS